METESRELDDVIEMMSEGYLSSFRMIEKMLTKISATFGIGWSGLSILNQVASNVNVTMSELSKQNNITKGAISIQLSDLLNSGLIEITEDEKDRRRHVITLTKKGLRLREREVAHVNDVAQRVLENMGDAEMTRLHSDFATFARVLEQTPIE